MKQVCPKCGSEQIKQIQMAHSMNNEKSAFKKSSSKEFECIKCGFVFKVS